jgi:membrane associated rhomboid family serine protease
MAAHGNRTTIDGFGSSHFTPKGVKWLLIANVAAFVLNFFAEMAGFGWVFRYFALVPRDVLHVWGIFQLVTYLFLHSLTSLFHIIFNMLTLWMIGQTLEGTWGTKRFLQYYFICGIGAGICVVIGNALFGSLDVATVGASGAIFGLLLALGVVFPDAIILAFMIFPMKAKYFAMLMGAIAFFSMIGPAGGAVSHVAHLGGMIFGYIYLKSKYKRIDIVATAKAAYKDWKLQRAKKKFQVYLRKQDKNPRIH